MHNIPHHQLIHRDFRLSWFRRVTVQVVVIMASSRSAALPLLDSCTNRSVPEITTIVRIITAVRQIKVLRRTPEQGKVRENHVGHSGHQSQKEQNGSKGIDKRVCQPSEKGFFLLMGHLVAAIPGPAGGHLFHIKAAKGGVQLLQNLRNRICCRIPDAAVLLVPDHCLFRSLTG